MVVAGAKGCGVSVYWDIVKRFSKARVVVVGDLILDRYIFGEAERISREAPVPVVRVERVEERLGGAGSVLANVVRMGAKASVVGVVGADEEGRVLRRLIGELGADMYLIEDCERPTTVKTRVIARGQHVVRIDREERDEVRGEAESWILDYVMGEAMRCDVVIVSDYAKGAITRKIMRYLSINGGEKVVVDPKPAHAGYYEGVMFMTPNAREALEMTGCGTVEEAGRKLMDAVICGVAITRGNEGVSLFVRGSPPVHIPAIGVREVYDVTGAGDAFVAAFSLAIAVGATPRQAAVIGNLAGGIEVSKLGAIPVTQEELLRAIEGGRLGAVEGG